MSEIEMRGFLLECMMPLVVWAVGYASCVRVKLFPIRPTAHVAACLVQDSCAWDRSEGLQRQLNHDDHWPWDGAAFSANYCAAVEIRDDTCHTGATFLAGTPTEAGRVTGRDAELEMNHSFTLMRCDIGEWTKPARVSGTASGKIARFSSIASQVGSLYVVGNDVQALDPSLKIANPLSSWELGGNSIGGPSGSFLFAYPRVGIDNRGRLAMVWAEPNEGVQAIDLISWLSLRFRTLWAATYEPGGSWSKPSPVYRGAVLWNKATSDGMVRTADGVLHLVTPSFEPGGPAMLHVAFDGERWIATAMEVGDVGVAYSSVAAFKNRLFVGFIAGNAQGNGRDVNSVFLIQSADSGKTWSEPILISRSGEQPAYDLKVRVDDRDRIHIVWVQALGGARILRHTMSSAGNWTPADDFRPDQENANQPQAVLDRCGQLHVVFNVSREDGLGDVLAHVVWVAGEWRSAKYPFGLMRSTDPSLTLLDDGSLLLVFLGRSENGSAEEPFNTLYSVLTPAQHAPGVLRERE